MSLHYAETDFSDLLCSTSLHYTVQYSAYSKQASTIHHKFRNLLVFKCNKDFFHCHIRGQVLSQGMGLGPSGGSRTHPPSPLKYGGLCFVMISLWMLLGDWGCGVHDTPRRQVLSQCMELGPNGGLRTHPPPFPH